MVPTRVQGRGELIRDRAAFTRTLAQETDYMRVP